MHTGRWHTKCCGLDGRWHREHQQVCQKAWGRTFPREIPVGIVKLDSERRGGVHKLLSRLSLPQELCLQ